MAGEGSLDYDRFELIEGALIPKVPKNHRHTVTIVLLVKWLVGRFGAERAIQEGAIDLRSEDNPINAPEPDFILLNESIVRLGRRPRSGDVSLLVEVSDSTLAFDLGVKARLYARAGIADYWVVDINGCRIISHRDPMAVGFRSIRTYSADERIAPLAVPDAEIRVEELLPPVIHDLREDPSV